MMQAPPRYPVTEHELTTARHKTFYFACGPEDAPLLIFVHGWPELAISWRHQLPVFAGLGFRVVAPDMRGYGRSSVYPRSDAYTLEQATLDMIELIGSLGREKAVWIGHDWGAITVWSIAQQHPERCHGVANLCVPYIPQGFGPENLIPLADRRIYPQDQYPAAQWDYQLHYIENLEAASRTFDTHLLAIIKAMFRAGNPANKGLPTLSSTARARGGLLPPEVLLFDLPRDENVIDAWAMNEYATALGRNGFFAPNSWYVNPDANVAFAAKAKATWRLEMPVLFVHAAYDYICETIDSDLAKPMRAYCTRLTEAHVESGHWMQQEKPLAVNAALARWLAAVLPELWTAK